MTGTIVSVTPLSPTVHAVEFTTSPALEFTAGQYIEAQLPGLDWTPFSLASSPLDQHRQLCIKEKPESKASLELLEVGVEFPIKPAEGGLVYRSKGDKPLCMIATGTGIAPLRSILRDRHQRGEETPETTLLLGVYSQEEILYEEEWRDYGVSLIPCLSDPLPGWEGFHGMVGDAIRAGVVSSPWRELDVYLCGHFEMVVEIRSLLQELGTTRASIFHERFIP